MPSKGQITACACVLFERPVVFSQFERAVAKDYEIARSVEQPGTEWMFAGPTLVVPFRPDVGGFALVDLVDQAWPDGMGDPEKDPTLYNAWGHAQFGPFTHPDGLKRASEQAWAWPAGRDVIENHTGFARVRTTYTLGGGDGRPLVPTDYDPVAELQFVTALAAKVMNLPQTLAYYSPGGEVLRGRAEVKDALQFAAEDELPPLDLWANTRAFPLTPDHLLMDLVGLPQLDAPGRPPFPDVEAVFPKDKFDRQAVGEFLHNLGLYLIGNGPTTVNDGDAVDGPGGSWTVVARNAGLMMPTRPTLRLCPAGEPIPEPFAMMGRM